MLTTLPRTMAERVSRNVVLKRKLPAELRKTPFYVSPASALRYWRFDARKFDDFLYDTAQKLICSGDSVWDVGANLGIFAFSAATQNAKVVAVEPDVFMAYLIRKSLDLRANQQLQVDLLPAAIASKVDVTKFTIANRGRATNHLSEVQGSSVTGGSRRQVSVLTVTLDWMLDHFAPPQFVKIDVEGAEHLVFQGAEKLLRDIRPNILFEVQAYNAQTVKTILDNNDYVYFAADSITTSLKQIDTLNENTLAVPREHADRVKAQAG